MAASGGGAGGGGGGSSSGSASGDMDDALSRLASSNNALQNLIRRLGTGLEDLLPNVHGRARMKEVLQCLKEHDNEVKQMEALTELCEMLSMGQEEMLIGFSVDAFLPVLVELLGMEHNPEIMLLSSRALTHLLEVLPKASAKVAASGAVPVFCQRLLTIEFMDVAEQSLLAMHKLAVEHPEPLLRSNGLAAVLTFIDFFDTNTQRTAAQTAANICRHVPVDGFPLVVDLVPNLTQLLSHSDQKITESAVLAFARLVDSFLESDDHLQSIAAQGMLPKLVALLRPGDREGRGFDVGISTYTSIVKTLAVCCRGSPYLAVSLLEEGVIPTVRSIIKKEEDERLEGNSLMAVVAVMRPLDQLFHTLTLANELLPPVPVDDTLSPFVTAVSRGSDAVQDLFGRQPSRGCLEAHAASHPGTLDEYAQLLFPILVDISVTIVNEAIRIKCLSAMAKLFCSMPADKLLAVVKDSPIVGYIAGFLSSGNGPVMGLALIITDMLMSKQPNALAQRFAREGIVYEVSRLASKEPVNPSPSIDALVAQARHIHEVRFGPGSQAAISAETDTLLESAAAVAKLLEEGDRQGLRRARELLSGEDTLSSYQVVTSGLAESMLRYLTSRGPEGLGAFVDEFCERESVVEKLRGAEEEGGAGQGGALSTPLKALVCKLNEAVSVREMFSVLLSDVSGDLTAGLKLLAQPLKLRLVRDGGDASLADYGGNVVLIEPLATINAVEDFLWAKVHQAPGSPSSPTPASSPPSASTPPAASTPTGAAGGAGGAAGGDGGSSKGDVASPVGGAGSDEGQGGASPPSLRAGGGGDSGEEDEPSADITRPTPSRPPAASAGAPQAPGGHGGHQLIFFVNGKALPYKSSIVQAIGVFGSDLEAEPPQEPAAAAAGGAAAGGGAAAERRTHGMLCGSVPVHVSRQAWDQVHTVTYRVIRPSDVDQVRALVQETGIHDPAGAADHRPQFLPGGTLLQRSLEEQLALRDRSVTPECGLVLRLLRALHVLSREWHLLYDGDSNAVRAALVPSGEFVNVKVASKLMRQLQDPLMLSTGSLPAWCAELVTGCPFLFPIECREFYTGCTAFGISRALHSMQQRVQGNSPSDRPSEVRIGRIQRQKIRVSRSRLLQSAMRALELYAGHRSMLEVEYYGEAGTGLGPTLEFFTLVSQELQGARLGLWRDSVAPKSEGGEGEEAAAAMREEPTDGLCRAPSQGGYIKGFHNVCVTRCSQCTTVIFTRCEVHGELLTKRNASDGKARCSQCDTSVAAESDCANCGLVNGMKQEWWMLSDEEATYLHSAYPAGEQSIDHVVLQCPECLSVNFPGTEQSLVLNRDGKMTSVTGKVMLEQDYRGVTRHVSGACTDLPLTKVPVRLAQCECAAAAAMIAKTPAAEDSMEEEAGREENKFVYAPHGLFPCAVGEEQLPMALKHFTFLGRLMGKALLDQRHLDLPLSLPFFALMVGRHLAFEDLQRIDPELHGSLSKLRAIAERHAAKAGGDLTLDGCGIEDLCLDFTVPGKASVELMPGGRDTGVTLDNLGQYVEAVARVTLVEGIEKQMQAFQGGFNEVFPIRHLRVFTPEELELHIRGDVEAWGMDTLRASIKPDHGYHEGSMPIVWLMSIMSSMSKKDRRLFMRFISGSPTLPAGGLRRLQPRLTVVRKEAEAPLTPDNYLPSVMTCANYLKLPEYSCEEVMRERLYVAMKEGQLSFLLS